MCQGKLENRMQILSQGLRSAPTLAILTRPFGAYANTQCSPYVCHGVGVSEANDAR